MKLPKKIILPIGWDNVINSLEEVIEYKEKSLREDLCLKILELEENYRTKRINTLKPYKDKLEQEYLLVSSKINHPKILPEFVNRRQAALVLAHYWQGEDLETIPNYSFVSEMTAQEAFDYALKLTAPNTPEREYVEKAHGYLWKDYHGRD